MLERIIFFVCFSFFNRADLFTDRQQGITETIEFSLVFTFGRFNHDGTCHRETHSGGMKPIINQTLGHIFCFDLG